MVTQNKKFYKTEELAELLDVSLATIYRYIRKGNLKAYKIDREIRVDNKDFNIFIRERKRK